MDLQHLGWAGELDTVRCEDRHQALAECLELFLESQISLTRKSPPVLNATWYSSPSGGHSPASSMSGSVSSSFSAVMPGAVVKRTGMLIVSSWGEADPIAGARDPGPLGSVQFVRRDDRSANQL